MEGLEWLAQWTEVLRQARQQGGVLLQVITYAIRVRVSDTIRIRYVDTHFLERNPTKMVYLSIRIRASDEYPCSTRKSDCD
jgi:hypothetical protein